VELIDRVRRAVTDAGMIAVGVTTADGFPEVRGELERRAADGSNAGMRFTYADPAVATDVRSSFPWAARLVVTAHAYLPEAGNPGPPAPGTGRIARFATADHYAPLRRGLAAIADVLTDAGHRAETLCDDNRLVDRAAAVRAGIAWWGSNAQALIPGPGPWALLGSVVTDAELPVSAPMRRDCGTCSACLPACPTGALVAPGVLDARRCLAHRAQAPGVIPLECRAAMGDRIYGCDDCLEACPPGSRVLDAAAEPIGRVGLVELLATDDRTLRERFAHFYVPRNQVRHLRRNALVALGNSGGPAGVVAGYLGHPDWLLRAHAAWALGRMGTAAAVAALRAAANEEGDERVAGEIETALAAVETG
jgi:epoxyqueuosine reductase